MKPGIRTTVVMLALLAALLAALSGCGSDSSDSTASDTAGDASTPASPDASSGATESPSASASPSDASPSATSSLPATDDPTEAVQLPACDTVWVEGQTFPRDYQGCLEGTKEIQADGLYCEFGKPLFSYGKHYYAVQNGPVNRTEQVLAKDQAFQKAQRSCGG